MKGNKPLDVIEFRSQFPILSRKIKGKDLIYFDNAATSQKPLTVIDSISNYYKGYNANIHRGLHTLADEATAAYESSREATRAFINATHKEEIIFTKGTTEGINLVASTWGKTNLNPGDEIILSTLEHHSNIVPWQMIAEKKGAVIKVIPINDEGILDMKAFGEMLTDRTKIISIIHVSNALGLINPIDEIISKAHANNTLVLLDGAQSAVHLDIDVKQLDCDFFVFSGHKIYGPTGVGVLYGKKQLLQAMPPYQGGGEMIKEVSFEKTIYNELPFKFEAGTPNIADVIALKSAIDFIESYGKDIMRNHEDQLLQHATEQLRTIPGLKIIGDISNKVSIISFVAEGIHPQDLAVLLDNQGVAVRTGHHCTQPLMKRLGIVGTTRASFAAYNTKEEIDLFIVALQKAFKMLL